MYRKNSTFGCTKTRGMTKEDVCRGPGFFLNGFEEKCLSMRP